ncbi:serine protease FAM111A-like [Eucyclogobius newberryi]|uniref:serine protease FAM111A-like n=1 Tax=Eucyclogobius newberryi TaxID=166745 RepID=UPI003B597007
MISPAEKENQNPNDLPQEKSQICHSTHSFEWRLGKRNPMNQTCNKAGTVEDSLRRSSTFRENEKKNLQKELVVVKSGKPIASHFPCTLIQTGDQLLVNYVKAVDNKPVAKTRPLSSDQIVVFNVHTKGGKNVTKIIRNPALRPYSELSVYAYKGEKVKHALKRDGRFLKSVFKKTCALNYHFTRVEMDNVVDHLDGKTFQIVLMNKNSPPESQPSSLEDTLDHAQRNDEDETLEQENNAENDENDNNETFEQGNDYDAKSWPSSLGSELHEIPDSQELKSHLSSLVSDCFEDKEQSDLLNVEYGRNHGSFTVETMTSLMTSCSDSVCQVRIGGSAVGSGFLLFDSFVLTNFHVIKPCFNRNSCQLFEIVRVRFSYKNLDQAAEWHQVKEAVVGEYEDWVLLELNTDQKLPSGLLEHFGFIPKSGSICIIGHPNGDVQRVDQSSILTTRTSGSKREDLKHYRETGELIQFMSPSFPQGFKVAFYDCCLYFGSSGSPVFDSHGHVVAMHSGGYVRESISVEPEHFIEYGPALSSILENLIVILVQKGKLDVLKKYLGCFNKHRDAINHHVKNLLTSENFTLFQNTAQSENVLNDDILKPFFDFICEPDSMEMGN